MPAVERNSRQRLRVSAKLTRQRIYVLIQARIISATKFAILSKLHTAAPSVGGLLNRDWRACRPLCIAWGHPQWGSSVTILMSPLSTLWSSPGLGRVLRQCSANDCTERSYANEDPPELSRSRNEFDTSLGLGYNKPHNKPKSDSNNGDANRCRRDFLPARCPLLHNRNRRIPFSLLVDSIPHAPAHACQDEHFGSSRAGSSHVLWHHRIGW